MSKTVPLAALLLAAAAAPAAAAERNFGINGFDRIRVEGPFRVRLATGVAPFARATGSPQGLDTIKLEVQGRTLIVRPNSSSWGGYPGRASGPVEISVGTHELIAASVNGSGTLAIDAVKGLAFDLSVQGAGSASIGTVAVDQLKVGIVGAGSATIAGNAPKLTALVRGISSLDASALAAKDAVLGADGPSTIRASVSNSAKVDATGTSHVELAGAPSCIVRSSGSATISGCK